jgi:hypothetical protein
MAVHEKPHRRAFAGAAGEFWHGLSFEELAQLQGVKPVQRIESVLGGWPAEEVEDGFEAELAEWRRQGFRDRNGA